MAPMECPVKNTVSAEIDLFPATIPHSKNVQNASPKVTKAHLGAPVGSNIEETHSYVLARTMKAIGGAGSAQRH